MQGCGALPKLVGTNVIGPFKCDKDGSIGSLPDGYVRKIFKGGFEERSIGLDHS